MQHPPIRTVGRKKEGKGKGRRKERKGNRREKRLRGRKRSLYTHYF